MNTRRVLSLLFVASLVACLIVETFASEESEKDGSSSEQDDEFKNQQETNKSGPKKRPRRGRRIYERSISVVAEPVVDPAPEGDLGPENSLTNNVEVSPSINVDVSGERDVDKSSIALDIVPSQRLDETSTTTQVIDAVPFEHGVEEEHPTYEEEEVEEEEQDEGDEFVKPVDNNDHSQDPSNPHSIVEHHTHHHHHHEASEPGFVPTPTPQIFVHPYPAPVAEPSTVVLPAQGSSLATGSSDNAALWFQLSESQMQTQNWLNYLLQQQQQQQSWFQMLMLQMFAYLPNNGSQQYQHHPMRIVIDKESSQQQSIPAGFPIFNNSNTNNNSPIYSFTREDFGDQRSTPPLGPPGANDDDVESSRIQLEELRENSMTGPNYVNFHGPKMNSNKQYKEIVENYPKFGANLYRNSYWAPIAPTDHWGTQLRDSSGLRNGRSPSTWPAYFGQTSAYDTPTLTRNPFLSVNNNVKYQHLKLHEEPTKEEETLEKNESLLDA